MKKAVTKNAVIGVTVDKEKLKEVTKKYLDASALYGEVKALAVFSWNDLDKSWRNLKAMIVKVVSAVEAAREELAAQSEGGIRADGRVALLTAVDVLDEGIVFTGPVGRIVEWVDGPILKTLIEFVLGSGPFQGNWLAFALENLGLDDLLG